MEILNEFQDWKCIVYGDEPREKIIFNHERLINKGYQSNTIILKLLKKSSIAVVCYKRSNEKKILSPTPDNAMQTY